MKRGFFIETFLSWGNKITSNEKANRWIKNTIIKIGSARVLGRIAGKLTLPILEVL
jgi:hypothetical protein